MLVCEYIFSSCVEISNLQKHLHQMHAEDYDRVVLDHKWLYKLSRE